METSRVQPENREQLKAITDFLKALNVNSGGDDQNSDTTSPNSGDKWLLNIKSIEIAKKVNTGVKKGKSARTKPIRRELFE